VLLCTVNKFKAELNYVTVKSNCRCGASKYSKIFPIYWSDNLHTNLILSLP
jgi:hypothetical protein